MLTFPAIKYTAVYGVSCASQATQNITQPHPKNGSTGPAARAMIQGWVGRYKQTYHRLRPLNKNRLALAAFGVS